MIIKNNIAIRIAGKVSRYIDASMNRATPMTGTSRSGVLTLVRLLRECCVCVAERDCGAQPVGGGSGAGRRPRVRRRRRRSTPRRRGEQAKVQKVSRPLTPAPSFIRPSFTPFTGLKITRLSVVRLSVRTANFELCFVLLTLNKSQLCITLASLFLCTDFYIYYISKLRKNLLKIFDFFLHDQK